MFWLTKLNLLAVKLSHNKKDAEDGTDPFAPQTSVENTNDDPFVTIISTSEDPGF